MRKLTILFIFVFACFSLNAQQEDTVYIEQKQQIEQLEMEVEELEQNFHSIRRDVERFNDIIKKDLERFNEQYNLGTRSILIGLGVTVSGVIISSEVDADLGAFTTAIGSVVGIIGVVVQVDAHKYLGGRESLTVGVRLDF